MIWLEHHRHQRSGPDPDVRCAAKKLNRNLQRDAEDVLVEKEIGSTEREAVTEPEQVEEEGVAPQTRKELHAVAARCKQRLGAKRHWRILEQQFLLVFAFEMPFSKLSRNFAGGPPSKLRPFFFPQDPIAERDVWLGVAIGIDQRFVHGAVAKFVGVPWR